ncbi:MAG: hypothetical protein RBS53_05820 [Bacteroidales bacterium]|jgi:hypothetical protein|nr:hypothetical protein [Bacteroidales bacterium]NLM92118.1 hypothetical protein [Bacteroidales bacterium]
MDLQSAKIEIIRMVLETDNPGILETIRKIFRKEESPDFWLSLSREEQDEILVGFKEIEQGELTDYEELLKKHR